MDDRQNYRYRIYAFLIDKNLNFDKITVLKLSVNALKWPMAQRREYEKQTN